MNFGCKYSVLNKEHHYLASDTGLSITESKFCSPPDGLMSLKDKVLGEEYSFSRRVD